MFKMSRASHHSLSHSCCLCYCSMKAAVKQHVNKLLWLLPNKFLSTKTGSRPVCRLTGGASFLTPTILSMSFSRAWSSHRDGSWVTAFLLRGTVQLGAGSLVWGPAGGAVLRWKSGHLCFTPWKQGGKNARPGAGGSGGAALPFSTNSYLPCLISLKEESKSFTTLDPASLAWLTEEPGPPEVTHTSQSPCSPESSQSSLAQEEEEEDQGRTRKRKQSGQSPARAGKQRMKEKEQENERKVAQLAEENERLKQEIERLTREVEATRRALIDRMVNLHQA